MQRNFQAVLFDLGDTLMYAHAAWPPILQQAAMELGDYLSTRKIPIDSAAFGEEFRQRLKQNSTERERSLIEIPSIMILHDMLTEKGYQDLPNDFLRAALDRYYAVTQQNWLLEEDAIPTLELLRSNNFHIGLVSNASDTQDVLALVHKFGIGKYFDFVLTSAQCNYRKPHPLIFETALSNWGYLPDEIAMVGDRLDADISGARPLGIYSIWITRRAHQIDPSLAHPDAIVRTLSEIPPLLFKKPE